MKKILFILLITGMASQLRAQFKPGNIAVLRVGDGVSTMYAGCQVSLLEYTVTGVRAGEPIVFPSAVKGNRFLQDLGVSSEYSQLRLSANGKYLTLVGNDTTTNVLPNSAINKVIARVGADRQIDLKTKFLAPAGGSMRGAVSDDGNRFWVYSSSWTYGLTAVPYGARGATVADYTIIHNINYRSAQLYGNQLYALSGAGSVLSLIGANGLPVAATSPVTAISIPDVTYAAGSVCFYLFDQSSKEPGLDVAYIFDGSNNTAYPTKSGNNLLRKFCKVSGAWLETGAIDLKKFADGPPQKPELLRDMTGEITSDGSVLLYAIRGVNTDNALVSIKDESGYNGKLAENTTILKNLASAGAGYSFKGVAYTPGSKPNNKPVKGK